MQLASTDPGHFSTIMVLQKFKYYVVLLQVKLPHHQTAQQNCTTFNELLHEIL